MARDHARIYVSIWSDPDFRALPVNAQHMYFTLSSQPRLSYCGVLDYLPSRLSKLAAKATARTVAAAVAVLAEERFVVVDDETGELLIRSFVRHDGILDSPNMAKAMVKAFETVLSDPLREALVDELTRAFAEDPGLKGWSGLEDASPSLFSMVSTNPSANPSGKGS